MLKERPNNIVVNKEKVSMAKLHQASAAIRAHRKNTLEDGTSLYVFFDLAYSTDFPFHILHASHNLCHVRETMHRSALSSFNLPEGMVKRSGGLSKPLYPLFPSVQ